MLQYSLSDISTFLWLSGAVFLRIGPAIAMSAGYGESYLPPRAKLGLGLALSAAIAPTVQEHIPVSGMNAKDIAVFMIVEITIGLFLGFVSRGMIYILQITGTTISQMASLSQLTPLHSVSMPTFAHIFIVTGLALFFYTPLHLYALIVFAESYEHITSQLDTISQYMSEKAADTINYIFNHGIKLSIGFLVVFSIYNLFIGFANKTFPQFMVSFIGIPFVALFSIIFLVRHFEAIFTVWQENAIEILLMPFENFP